MYTHTHNVIYSMYLELSLNKNCEGLKKLNETR